jgi:hypothetical protein
VLLAGFAALTLACGLAAPAYRRWSLHMRRPGADERALCVPPSDEAGSPSV